MGDLWASPVAAWMNERPLIGGKGLAPIQTGFTTLQALSGIGMPLAQANKANEIRMARVLSGLGLIQIGGVWSDANRKTESVWD